MPKYIDVSPYDDCRIVCNSEDKGIPVKDIPAADVQEAVALIKEYGFSLGLQMMTGLYGDRQDRRKKKADSTNYDL